MVFNLFFRLFTTTRKSYFRPVKTWDSNVENPLPSQFSDEALQALISAKVINVIDGDTIIASIYDDSVKIRLDSIDSPEDNQEWGDFAKYGLIKLIGGKNVFLETHGLDNYGRTLATIYALNDKFNWINVNERMVLLGHAWVMRLYYKHLPADRQKALNSKENWARKKKVGLWKSKNPIPPWQWRS